MVRALQSLAFVFCCSAIALARHDDWKEYVYKTDGFAVDLPSEPTRHPDRQIPRTTNFDLSYEDGPFRIGVVDQDRDCDATLRELKDGVLSGKQSGADKSSLKDLVVVGRPGLEFKHRVGSETRYERYVCGNRGFYFFYAKWPLTGSMPASVNRILNSFRLVDASGAK
jgi:hypothetical protein